MLTGLQQELTPSCSPNELSKIAKETLYIGLSRAQSFLYIIDQPRIIKEINNNNINIKHWLSNSKKVKSGKSRPLSRQKGLIMQSAADFYGDDTGVGELWVTALGPFLHLYNVMTPG